MRTVHECLQSILWDGTVGLTSLAHALPEGLTSVALTDKPSSDLVIAWNSTDTSPLIRSFVHIATAVYGSARKTT